MASRIRPAHDVLVPRRRRRRYAPPPMDLTTQATPIGQVALGTFLGYVIGFERELRGKAAGRGTIVGVDD